MKIQAILCDFDGTLVDVNHKYNSDVPELLEKIKSKNVHFSIATGRALYSGIERILRELKIEDYHIFNGGALIMNNKTRKVIWQKAISSKSSESIRDYLLATKLNFAFETIANPYINKIVEFPKYASRDLMRSVSLLSNYSEVLKIIIFGALNNLNESEIESFKDEIARRCSDVSLIKFKYKDRFGLDVTSEEATKHTSVLEYEKLLNIPRSQIVAMGDGYNDYPLFTACGYKIAMENAPDELKQIADFVAPRVEENGTVVALNHIISKFSL